MMDDCNSDSFEQRVIHLVRTQFFVKKIVTVRRHFILRRSSVAELASTILTIVESNSGWSYSIRGLPCSFLLNDLNNDAASLFSSQTLLMPSLSFNRRSLCRFDSL